MAAAEDQGPAGEQPAPTEEPTLSRPAFKFSPQTVDLLRDLTPEQRAQAIAITARLLALKAAKRRKAEQERQQASD